jgi:hypothetical protein
MKNAIMISSGKIIKCMVTDRYLSVNLFIFVLYASVVSTLMNLHESLHAR